MAPARPYNPKPGGASAPSGWLKSGDGVAFSCQKTLMNNAGSRSPNPVTTAVSILKFSVRAKAETGAAEEKQARHRRRKDQLRRPFVLSARRSVIGRTITLVPTLTREYRSVISSFVRRRQPEDTWVPIVPGALVP